MLFRMHFGAIYELLAIAKELPKSHVCLFSDRKQQRVLQVQISWEFGFGAVCWRLPSRWRFRSTFFFHAKNLEYRSFWSRWRVTSLSRTCANHTRNIAHIRILSRRIECLSARASSACSEGWDDLRREYKWDLHQYFGWGFAIWKKTDSSSSDPWTMLLCDSCICEGSTTGTLWQDDQQLTRVSSIQSTLATLSLLEHACSFLSLFSSVKHQFAKLPSIWKVVPRFLPQLSVLPSLRVCQCAWKYPSISDKPLARFLLCIADLQTQIDISAPKRSRLSWACAYSDNL